MSRKISLTGIKPTGAPHIGNYFGAIRPALALAEQYEARYFIADYHALNTIRDGETLRNYTYEVAATWLACGLDPEKALFYRQSDVPETFELATFLNAFTAKGFMNRAHAYKAAVQANEENGRDQDAGINMGLYSYPVLMAADILLFQPHIVPVGKDQKQHVEITADIAQVINHNYQQQLLQIPEPVMNESCEVVTGLDGRKMSKSYDNTIPMFLPAKKLRKTCMKIVSNSQGVEEAKSTEDCNIFKLYQIFADENQQQALKERYAAGGMGWGHAKQELFEVMDAAIAPMREKYNTIIADRGEMDRILAEGAEKARSIAGATMSSLRKAAGISI